MISVRGVGGKLEAREDDRDGFYLAMLTPTVAGTDAIRVRSNQDSMIVPSSVKPSSAVPRPGRAITRRRFLSVLCGRVL
jgi:hypothetical protein